MPYLIKNDLVTHIYIENINNIIRNVDDIADRAIAAAVAQAKSYLSRYDLVKLFDPLAVGYVSDDHLKNIVKDLACWHLVKLANPNIDLQLFRDAFEDAIAWLVQVQSGKCNPDGWPFKTDDPATNFNEGGDISIITNPKRNNHY